MQLQKVTDRIYYLPHDETNDRCTIGLIVGDKHTLMVDAGASEAHVDLFMSQLKQNKLPMPDMCVLTHWHWDHTYGLSYLDVVSFASKSTNELIKKMATWSWAEEDMLKRIETGEDLAFSYPYINTEYPDKSKINIAHATVEYELEVTLDLGGVTAIVKKTPNSHSEDCSVIFIPQEKTIFLGDIHYEDLLPQPPAYYRENHKQLITALRKYDFDKVISGHQSLMTNVDLFIQLENAEFKY